MLAAYLNVGRDVPRAIVDAVHDAMEVAVENVPQIEGKVFVCVDVSGSMRSPVTGNRPGATTKVACVHAAALMAASILRRNPDAEIVVFSDRVHESVRLEPRDTVITNAHRLASEPSGGTNCSAPIAYLNRLGKRGGLVVMVSDDESWCDSSRRQFRATGGDATAETSETRLSAPRANSTAAVAASRTWSCGASPPACASFDTNAS